MTDSVVSEFYAPPVRDLGDPAQDPPMTVRVERWADRRRTDVRRAVKVDDPRLFDPWIVLSGGMPGVWLTDDHVRTWPVCPDVVTQAAYALAARRTAPALCPVPSHTIPGGDGELVATPVPGCATCAAWMAAGHAPSGRGEQAHERGDLDVEVFRG